MEQKKLRLSRRTNKRRAQSLVEFCLCVPILIMLLIGAADIGLLMWTEMTITESIRSGAVFATSLVDATSSWDLTKAGIVKTYIVTITRGTGLTEGEITISTEDISGVASLTIKVDHLHTYIAPVSFNGLRAESTLQTFMIRKRFTCGFIGNTENFYDFNNI